MAGKSVEDIKRESQQLRGTIAQELADPSPKFSDDNVHLLKFHGIYQGDNRDQRSTLRKQGLDLAYEFMIRSKIPGGVLTAQQYLVHDRLAQTLGNGTLRITSRQGLQFHSVVKGNLHEMMRGINESGIRTWGACGDVVRNVTASSAPLTDAAHQAVQQLATELSQAFYARSRAYSEIWLDGERLPEIEEDSPVGDIYGDVYLPRKFKFAIAIPPRNDVDIFTNDVGFVLHQKQGVVEGYTVVVGGGLGMTFGKLETYPRLASPLFFIRPEHALAAAKAIVSVERDFGNREDRKLSRLKYLIDSRGLDWFREEVIARMDGIKVDMPRVLRFRTMMDLLGWHEHGDGRWYCGVRIDGGRLNDFEHVKYRSGIRALAERFQCEMRFTANHNILFCGLNESDRDEFDRIMAEYGIPQYDQYAVARRYSMSCVSLPTCSLGLAESERIFEGVMDKIEAILRELNLEDEAILFRLSGCPNGCSRPYNADFGFVGRAPGKYALYVGGSYVGDRLAQLEERQVELDEIPNRVRYYLEEFTLKRQFGEMFSDYWARTRRRREYDKVSHQFHLAPDVPGQANAMTQGL